MDTGIWEGRVGSEDEPWVVGDWDEEPQEGIWDWEPRWLSKKPEEETGTKSLWGKAETQMGNPKVGTGLEKRSVRGTGGRRSYRRG